MIKKILLLLLSLFILPFSQSVSALTLDEQIKQNCTSAQINLKQLQKRDAVSRINRGRAYDSMLRQISALNSRFAYNKINTTDMIQVTSNLQNSIDDFRSIYSSYDEQLSRAINVNCKEDTDQFYEYIVNARGNRLSLANRVNDIDIGISNYRSKLVEYQSSLPLDNPESVTE